VIDFIKNSVEYQNFGSNLLPFSFLATIFLSLAQGYGIVAQFQKIRKNKAAGTIINIFFVYNCLFCLSFFGYGLLEHKLAFIFNGGLLGLLYIPVLVVLYKFKGFTKLDIVLSFAGLIIIPAMILAPNKEIVLTVSILLMLPTVAWQFIEFLRTKSLGELSLAYVTAFFINSVFWLIYSLAIHNLTMILLNAGTSTLYAVVIVLSIKFDFERKKIMENGNKL